MSDSDRDQEMRRMAREVLGELVPGILGRAANGNGVANGNEAAHANGHANGFAHTPVPQVPAPPTPAVLRPSTWNRPAAPGEVIGQPGPGGAAPAPGEVIGQPGPGGAAPAPGEVIGQPGTGGAAPAPAAAASKTQPSPARPEAQPSPAPPRATASPPPTGPPAAPTPAGHRAIANPGADARVEVVAIDSDDDLMQFVRQLISRVANPRDRLAIHTGKLRFTLRSRPGSSAVSSAAPAGPVTRIAKGVVTERVIRDVADSGARLVLAPGTVLTPLARERAHALGVEIEKERK